MRRRAYPYGRYLLADREIQDLGPEMKDHVESLGFPVVKYDPENEGRGTLIVAVNKTVKEFLKQKKPAGRLRMILSGFSVDTPSFRETDIGSQRVGVELYLWPVEEGTLLELFVIPYMKLLNRPEIYGITESKEEEITDWYLCELVWENLVPKMETEFDMESVHRRG